jgi:hypothetical protein
MNLQFTINYLQGYFYALRKPFSAYRNNIKMLKLTFAKKI